MLCWGNASFGQLGLGGIDEEIVLEPRKSDFFLNKRIRDVGCGLRHTVFVLDDGTVYTCGCNDLGQLGHEKARKRPEHVGALDAQNIVAVSCGEAHTLALNDKGQVYAWGLATDGQLGLPGTEECIRVPRNIKSLSEIQIVQVACGYYHSLALSKGSEVFSWGQNKYGQLGLGYEYKKQNSPHVIKSLLGIPFAQIAAGGAHSFVLTLSGAIFGWGRNKFGQLGLNDDNDRYVPTLLKSLRTQKVVHICCGEDHTAALTKEGGVFTFGAGGYGQLGHNSTSHEINPRKVFELMGSLVTQITCGRQHTTAFVPSSGRIYSFGLGGNGQLGTGTTSNRKSPFTVKGNWLPYSTQCLIPADSEQYYCVKRIFSGGDQSFAHYFYPQNMVPPDDFRYPDLLKQIWTVNETFIQRLLTFPSGRLPVEIANEIDGTFSSAGCLNGSFLALSNDDHYKTSVRFSGVDMNAARLLFHKLIQPDHAHISQQVAASLEKNLIPKLSSSLPDVEALRLYLTLPECPLMSDANNFTTLAIPFGTAILKLEKAPLKVLENWWSVLEPPLFLKIVELYKDVVVHLLKLYKIGIPPSERRIFTNFLHTAFRVLEILHRVNERGQVIQYDRFYIHEIQDLIDIRNDYVNWVQQQVFGMDVNHGLTELTDMPVTICTYPFVFDAQAKTTLLQTDAVMQMQMAVDQAHRQNLSSLFLPVFESVNPCLILMVRRDNIVGDAVEVLRKTKNVDYKKPLKVIFVGEEAVDVGGVRKEFFLLIMRELLDPKYGMFRYYEESRLIWFSDKTFEDSDLFHLIGVVCGLAIYNFTIVDLHFPLALYKKLLNKKPSLDDLKELMPDVGRGMQQLLDYPEDDIEEAFCLNFTITVENFGTTEIKELVPNGADIPVVKHNRQDFVDAYVDYIFNKSVASLFSAFHAGFHKVCGGKVLQLFQPSELQSMVIGNTNYDWKELEKNTEYKGEYWADHPTIKIFWEVFHQLPLEKKKQFLLFLTGSDRIPILGMKCLKLVIQPTGGGEGYLPVAHTCFNLLDLPKYTDKETLKSKLIQAIDHYEGFSLV
ncbi:probable E3 ubiquitin-protein ligase HERC4 isoform X1 [Gallus gallus]|uniref:HECT-type E3 ubiquitin transferase n=1 Tax=Gallus gallus TaxID=9031 RepID=A0A8V0ZSA3_CHICK|nr:probable E3 ubiquitin-protein ligase HERC4 isoform X1 [Gallus gallus]XP_015134198.1 probable E3 ubiquitin-protein ligase HERC4 isoform X1 [Gallus gallus]XP_015134199.1 probable E3 ubiquitin-protein ligase HERC4 isoform X1 [Gallus gallus]XP_025007450.1 probable E3 ubiquitin-protein ligase HERC4 isoform X1 [Gallus gallus]XP_025007451.1 probable E3 ubiquitin-protein ligase HERC4 isoform X1 [Gallus gallus]XP_040531253.1 probable E3 ubiquitin-protein ligase HERC4 isoform X1 [Gallus gallus]XP_04|eukprot:XP_015134197.1 probable E3 ubiquitin-protein ligase HERC4 isoform X1 [Gallus gallus]